MSPRTKHESLRVALALQVLTCFVPLEGVTVNPVRCPTNKIAPHRRAAYFGNVGSRAYGAAFYDLLAPGAGGSGPYSQAGLQERPQEDDPDDCGDIEDYDETDLSSVSQPYRRGHTENRFFFGGLFGNRPAPAQRPTSPPVRPTKPPYWSAGYFGSNSYRPPLQQEPSVYVKPVHEGDFESQSTYRPQIVGGPLGHIVGHAPARPTSRPPDTTTEKRLNYYTSYPHRTEAPVYNARPRPSRPRAYYNDGILGSFVDLLFK